MKCDKCASGTWEGFEQGLDCPGCGASPLIGPYENDLVPKLPVGFAEEFAKRVASKVGKKIESKPI